MNRRKLIVIFSSIILTSSCISQPTEQPSASTSPSMTETTVRVLFIGNSHTFFNDLPEMFAELSRSGGYEVEVDMSAQGGWSLADHASSSITLSKIEQQDWNYVILQERTSLIIDNPEDHMYPAIRILCEKIRAQDAIPILFMIWGPRDGLPSTGYKNFHDTLACIYSNCMDIAHELDLLVAPVGIAWEKGIERDPQVNLWNSDGSHPSKEGSYLAACVFYIIIFNQNPEGLTYTAGLTEEKAHFLQNIAADTILNGCILLR